MESLSKFDQRVDGICKFFENDFCLPMQVLRAVTDEQFDILAYSKYLKPIDHCFRC